MKTDTLPATNNVSLSDADTPTGIVLGKDRAVHAFTEEAYTTQILPRAGEGNFISVVPARANVHANEKTTTYPLIVLAPNTEHGEEESVAYAIASASRTFATEQPSQKRATIARHMAVHVLAVALIRDQSSGKKAELVFAEAFAHLAKERDSRNTIATKDEFELYREAVEYLRRNIQELDRPDGIGSASVNNRISLHLRQLDHINERGMATALEIAEGKRRSSGNPAIALVLPPANPEIVMSGVPQKGSFTLTTTTKGIEQVHVQEDHVYAAARAVGVDITVSRSSLSVTREHTEALPAAIVIPLVPVKVLAPAPLREKEWTAKEPVSEHLLTDQREAAGDGYVQTFHATQKVVMKIAAESKSGNDIPSSTYQALFAEAFKVVSEGNAKKFEADPEKLTSATLTRFNALIKERGLPAMNAIALYFNLNGQDYIATDGRNVTEIQIIGINTKTGIAEEQPRDPQQGPVIRKLKSEPELGYLLLIANRQKDLPAVFAAIRENRLRRLIEEGQDISFAAYYASPKDDDGVRKSLVMNLLAAGVGRVGVAVQISAAEEGKNRDTVFMRTVHEFLEKLDAVQATIDKVTLGMLSKPFEGLLVIKALRLAEKALDTADDSYIRLIQNIEPKELENLAKIRAQIRLIDAKFEFIDLPEGFYDLLDNIIAFIRDRQAELAAPEVKPMPSSETPSKPDVHSLYEARHADIEFDHGALGFTVEYPEAKMRLTVVTSPTTAQEQANKELSDDILHVLEEPNAELFPDPRTFLEELALRIHTEATINNTTFNATILMTVDGRTFICRAGETATAAIIIEEQGLDMVARPREIPSPLGYEGTDRVRPHIAELTLPPNTVRIIAAASPINPKAAGWSSDSSAITSIITKNFPSALTDEDSDTPFSIVVLDSQGGAPTLNVTRRKRAVPS